MWWTNVVTWLYVFVSGVVFGFLQMSNIFVIMTHVASTAMLFLLASTMWLIGSAVGLLIPGRRFEWTAMLVGLASHGLLCQLAWTYPLQRDLLPVYCIVIAMMGVYAGSFFRCSTRIVRSVRGLLVVETVGFVFGTVATSLVVLLSGNHYLLTYFVLAATLVLALRWAIRAGSTPLHPA